MLLFFNNAVIFIFIKLYKLSRGVVLMPVDISSYLNKFLAYIFWNITMLVIVILYIDRKFT